MKLKDWLDNLNAQVELDPTMLEMDVVYGSDDEGNDFNWVSYTASKGHYADREFKDFADVTPEEYNAVCLN